MNDIVLQDDSDSFDLSPSILDGQYSISLKSAINRTLPINMAIIQTVVDIVSDANSANKARQKSEVRYVVDMSDEMIEKIESGVIKLDYSKDGRIFAQIRDGNHFGRKLGIKRELTNNGVDPQELRSAVQMMAIQQKLQMIADTIDDISEGVADVLKGQQNDRLGLFYSGMALMLEAREIEDETLRKLISSQAIKALSDATGQLTQEIQENIRFLLDGEHKRGRKGDHVKQLEERMARINLCFDAIHRAAVLKAAVYYNEGEPSAFLLAVEEYARFVSRVIAPCAGKLIEFDRNDTLLADGKWETRAKALEEASELRKQLMNETVFYLVPSESSDEVSEDVLNG